MHSFPSPLPFPRLFSMFVIAALRCFASPLRYATRVCYAATLLRFSSSSRTVTRRRRSFCSLPVPRYAPIYPDIPRYTVIDLR